MYTFTVQATEYQAKALETLIGNHWLYLPKLNTDDYIVVCDISRTGEYSIYYVPSTPTDSVIKRTFDPDTIDWTSTHLVQKLQWVEEV